MHHVRSILGSLSVCVSVATAFAPASSARIDPDDALTQPARAGNGIIRRAPPPGSPEEKLATPLRWLVSDTMVIARPENLAIAPSIRANAAGELHAYVYAAPVDGALVDALAAAGARVERIMAEPWHSVECRIPVDRLADIARIDAVRFIDPVLPGVTGSIGRRAPTSGRPAGSIVTEGDAILEADLVRALGHDGTGVKVGVISGDVDHLADAQAAGELPADVEVLRRWENDDDEGTAMLEVVHDLAPGAALAFASGNPGYNSFIEAVDLLVKAGCDVIVDDIYYGSEPVFDDGYLDATVDNVVADGIVYVAHAGNWAERHYGGTFVSSPEFPGYHAWNGANDALLGIRIDAHQTVNLDLKWDDAYFAAANDYDIYLLREPIIDEAYVVGRSERVQDGDDFPNEFFLFEHTADTAATFYLAVRLFAGKPGRLSFVVHDHSRVRLEYVTPEGSIWGHSGAAGAITVGALRADDPDHDELFPYSSRGPALVVHPRHAVRLKPDVAAIAGVSTSGVGGFPGPGKKFAGTSAAAPHVAGVAALLLSAHPDWTPDRVRAALTETALDIGPPGPDTDNGYGRVRALAALGLETVTHVRGEVRTMTWAKANGPYRVTGEVRVPAGETLTIEPGVDVLFDVDTWFIVEGALRAGGAPPVARPASRVAAIDSVRFLPGAVSEWGGIWITGGDSSAIAGTRISGGHADGSEYDGYGGGIYVDDRDTRLLLAHTVLSGNVAAGNGGAIFVGSHARVTLDDCRIAKNEAGGSGGGIAGESTAAITVRRSLVYGNVAADRGGAIDARSVTHVVVENGTIAGNRAIDGGGVALTSGSDARIRNSILWDDVPGEIYRSNGIADVTWSDVRMANGTWSGLGNINGDPLFRDAAHGDFALATGSPCIDAGDPIGPPGPDGSRADMGAAAYFLPAAMATSASPAVFALFPPVPNPFNPSTAIRFSLPASGMATLAVYTVQGQLVRTLISGDMTAGAHEVVWDGTDTAGRRVASGVYLYRLTHPSGEAVHRMTLLR